MFGCWRDKTYVKDLTCKINEGANIRRTEALREQSDPHIAHIITKPHSAVYSHSAPLGNLRVCGS